MAAPTVVVRLVERAWVEAMDVGPAQDALSPLVVDGEVTRRYAGSLLFMYSGLDECEFQLWDIPQAGASVRETTSSFPHARQLKELGDASILASPAAVM